MELLMQAAIALTIIGGISISILAVKAHGRILVWVTYLTVVFAALIFFTAWDRRVKERGVTHSRADSATTPSPAPTPKPFSVAVETVMSQTTRDMGSFFWIGYTWKYGGAASPLHVAMFMRLINNQPIPSMIDSFSVETKDADEWIKLYHVDIRSGTVFMAGNGFSKAVKLDFRANGFDYLVDNRALHPHEQLRGWAFFELPRSCNPFGPYRFHIRDTAGVEFTEVVESAKQDTDAVQGAAMEVVKGYWDMSQAQRRYYSEPVK